MNIQLLEQSFQLVKDRGEEFSTTFYANLLTDYPDLQPLFANTDMEKQKRHLFDSLRYVVDNLRKPETIQKALRGLGTGHVKYGVLPQHYPMVGGALLKTFESFIDWTPEVEEAWTDAYVAISKVMLEGANYPQEILKLPQ